MEKQKEQSDNQLKQEQQAKVNNLAGDLRLKQAPQDHIASAINLLNEIAKQMWNEHWVKAKFDIGITTAYNIIDYGLSNGKSPEEIAIAVKTAYIESTLGNRKGSPKPNSTISGLFQYRDDTWKRLHPGKNKNSDRDMIEAIYKDIGNAKEKYNNERRKDDRKIITFDEFFYITHHDGSAPENFSDENDEWNEGGRGKETWDNSKFHPSILPKPIIRNHHGSSQSPPASLANTTPPNTGPAYKITVLKFTSDDQAASAEAPTAASTGGAPLGGSRLTSEKIAAFYDDFIKPQQERVEAIYNAFVKPRQESFDACEALMKPLQEKFDIYEKIVRPPKNTVDIDKADKEPPQPRAAFQQKAVVEPQPPAREPTRQISMAPQEPASHGQPKNCRVQVFVGGVEITPLSVTYSVRGGGGQPTPPDFLGGRGEA